MARILVADDDRAIRESLQRALQFEGHDVEVVPNGVRALQHAQARPPDVLVLDVMMPLADGLTVCKVLRADAQTLPILMLTAKTQTRDRVAGLDAGADDYLAKPFELEELLARVRALLRRTNHTTATRPNEVLVVDDLRVDPSARRAWRGDVELSLSKTEFDLLELLIRNAGIVLEHATIYQRIWDYDFGPDSKNLAVYISYLRRKIDGPSHGPALIHNVRGVGYTLRAG